MKVYKIVMTVCLVDDLPLPAKTYIEGVFLSEKTQQEHYFPKQPRLLGFRIDKVDEVEKCPK